jgi:hypothetical protein
MLSTSSRTRFLVVGVAVGLVTIAPIAHSATAQSRTGTTAATFLTIGTGAKGQSLGNAYTAHVRGADAMFWNPAGLARPYADAHLGGAFFTHHEWLADINYNSAAVGIPLLGTTVIGMSIASVDYGRMDVRTVQLPEGTGETFGASDLSLGFTVARPLTQSFYFGGSIKYIRQNIRDNSASTVAFDVGFVLETEYLNGLQLAASIQNFGGKMQMSGLNGQVFVDIDPSNSGNNNSIPARLEMDSWDLPLSFRFGVALPVVRMNNVELVAFGDANQTNDNDLNSDFGGLLKFGTKTFNLEMRVGYRDAFIDNVDSHLTYGAGLDVRVSSVRFGFDFAYIPYELLGSTRLVDFRIYF